MPPSKPRPERLTARESRCHGRQAPNSKARESKHMINKSVDKGGGRVTTEGRPRAASRRPAPACACARNLQPCALAAQMDYGTAVTHDTAAQGPSMIEDRCCATERRQT
eukprot:gene2541-4111_t